MNRRQRRQRLKEMNTKVNKKEKIEPNLEKSSKNTDIKNPHPIKWKENLTNLGVFSIISLAVFYLDKTFNSKATAELVKALNEHSAPNSVAILLFLWVLFSSLYNVIYTEEFKYKKLVNMLIFAPLNFAFNLAFIWIPISVISYWNNGYKIAWNMVLLIFFAYISIILLYNTDEYKEDRDKIRLYGIIPLIIIFYGAFFVTLMCRFIFS